jgi:hypothetical protein
VTVSFSRRILLHELVNMFRVNTEDGGSIFLRNTVNTAHFYMVPVNRIIVNAL